MSDKKRKGLGFDVTHRLQGDKRFVRLKETVDHFEEVDIFTQCDAIVPLDLWQRYTRTLEALQTLTHDIHTHAKEIKKYD